MKRSPMPRRRATTRRSERVRDPGYMDRVRELPCCARDLSLCVGPIEADHAAKKRGMGAKCDDADTIPVCSVHHMARHNLNGVFKGWSREQMRAWLDEQIANTRAALARPADSLEAR